MKKRTKKLACMIAEMILLFAALHVLCLGCSAFSAIYSEEEHLSRVRKLAEERYLGEGSEYTGLEVYPLYNENDEFKYVLVELQPKGYVYVQVGGHGTQGARMYTKSSGGQFWRPYVFEEGVIDTVPNENGAPETWEGKRCLLNEDGEYIGYYVSPFKAAEIQNERRYLITLIDDSDPRGHKTTVGTLFAVKRGENYLNLVSGKEIPCSSDFGDEALQTTIEVLDVYFFVGEYF